MGVYNCKDFSFLKKSIDSIIKQIFTDWEFILCDDDSTDDTNVCFGIQRLQYPEDALSILDC